VGDGARGRKGRGLTMVVVTPHVTASLIKSHKLQLSLKARANQVVKD
jgi:hypothetical protein